MLGIFSGFMDNTKIWKSRFTEIWEFMLNYKITSSMSFELFVLSVMQEDVYTLCQHSHLVCESSVRLGPP